MDNPSLSAAIVAEWGAALERAVEEAAATLLTADRDGIEQQLQDLSRRVLGPVVEQPVALRATAQPVEAPACPQCGAALRLVDSARDRHLQGLVGEYRLVRAYWPCAPCGQGAAPLDAALGIGPGALSPGLSRVACRLGIEEAFAPAAELL